MLATVGFTCAFVDWLLVYNGVYVETSRESVMVRAVGVTPTTLLLVAAVAYYHVLRMRLFLLANNSDDWLLACRPPKPLAVTVELLFYSLHPLPHVWHFQVGHLIEINIQLVTQF